MAKKTTKKEEVKKPIRKGSPATAGMKKRIENKPVDKSFNPTPTERVAAAYINRRQQEMENFRRGLGIEQKWQEADQEYIPHELDFGTTRKRFETDQDSGLRSRMVPVGDVTQQWRQAASAPTLLVKIQSALSLIIDQMPEADLVPLTKKFEKTTDLAYSLWKRNWSITNAREKLKLVVFDLMKYGWAAQRTFPRTVKYMKRVLVEKDTENPDNDKYEEKEITWFNDVDRERLNVFTTWIDEMARPYDPFSTNESYYELDYSYDDAKVLFGHHPNFAYVKKNAQMVRNNTQRKNNRQEPNQQLKDRQDIVTIGFFESRHKDMYAIYVPQQNIPIYLAPLPNDDGYLSINHTLWLLRKSDMPYGVSMWEVIRQNKQLYDKMKNMGMDQLVLSIMKFGFFSGTNTAVGDGKIDIVPGQARQLTSSTGKPEVDWMEIPGPGQDFWKGVQAIDEMIDNDSGITPSLEGQTPPGPQTLGEILHMRESALKRLKVPVDNIAYLIDQDAYLTLSWMSQIYTIPNIIEFTSTEAVQDYNQENGVNHYKLFANVKDDGSTDGPYEAHYLPELALHLEDTEGKLKRSKESKFFQIGDGEGQINPKDLKWRGIFKTRPRSIIDTSQELSKASKMEMFNSLVPLLQLPPELAAKPAEQICKINEEDPKEWLPQAFLDYLKNPQAAAEAQKGPPQPEAAPGQGAGESIFTPGGPVPPEEQPQGQPAPAGAPAQPQTLQGQQGMGQKQAQTVVPKGQITIPSRAKAGVFNRKL